MQRRWPGLFLAPLLEGWRGTSETDAGPRRGLTKACIRRQRLQDVSQTEGDVSTPAPTFSNRLSQLACLFTYPGDPCAAFSSKGDFPCRLERLKEFVRLEEGLDSQCIEDSECEQKQEYVLRKRHFFRWFDCGMFLDTFGVIEVNWTVEAEFG